MSGLALQWTSILPKREGGNKNTVVTLYQLTLEMRVGLRGLNALQSETPFRPFRIFCLQQKNCS